MNYIVMDLEWNQGIRGKDRENETIPFEIIEIGAVKLNSDFYEVGTFSRLIKPQIYREMHQITSQLVHINMKQLKREASFVEVMEDFLEWCGREEYLFVTWGPLDLTELQRNMEFYGMDPLFTGPAKFLDLQKIFSIAYEDAKIRRTLEWAIEYLDMEKDIPFHRAFSDACYTARILQELPHKEVLQKVSFDLYVPPRKREDEVKIQFPDYVKYISRVFPDKKTAFSDKEVASSKCYLCHRNLKKQIKWFTPNGKHYYCVAYCELHGYLKGKIRVRKVEEGGLYIVKTTKFISEAQVQEILDKKEKKNTDSENQTAEDSGKE